MHEITYSKDILDVIYKFTSTMSKEVLFVKENGKVVIRQKTEVGVYNIFTTDEVNFNFTGETLAFLDFVNFYEFVDMLKTPKLFQDGNKIVLVKDNTKINYLISDPEAVSRSQFSAFTLPPSTIAFAFDEKELNNIRNLIKKMNIDNVRFSFDGTKCNLTLFKAGYDNSSEVSIDLPQAYDGNLDLEIKSYLFKFTPSLPYSVEVYAENPERAKFKFSYANDLFSLDVLTSVRND